mmetsp:Transcript_9748/g.8588  ORF Transcript_9748/g.8588 Transcript_9748/m.8588 type:complete len:98 (+) Transcript_9748:20-313(+)
MNSRHFEREDIKSFDGNSVARTDIILPPSLPSNLDQDKCYPAKFNTNGFYGEGISDNNEGSSIQERLDGQIRAIMNVYNDTVGAIDKLESEKAKYTL